GQRARLLFQDDGPFQPPITSFGDSLVDLYKHICPLDHAGNHGSQPERGVWYLLEMRAYWRTTQSLCQHMLFCDGCLDLCRWL
ncbi:S-adenosylmethionine-dependent methyltransferase, partial [Penicillium odoratum]|uniref:S-adenosylmethionine-dependent methyltransferase n=1 Tax=Penicillium odoratum TaxID=1167516 RepID=UPI002546E0F7